MIRSIWLAALFASTITTDARPFAGGFHSGHPPSAMQPSSEHPNTPKTTPKTDKSRAKNYAQQHQKAQQKARNDAHDAAHSANKHYKNTDHSDNSNRYHKTMNGKHDNRPGNNVNVDRNKVAGGGYDRGLQSRPENNVNVDRNKVAGGGYGGVGYGGVGYGGGALAAAGLTAGLTGIVATEALSRPAVAPVVAPMVDARPAVAPVVEPVVAPSHTPVARNRNAVLAADTIAGSIASASTFNANADSLNTEDIVEAINENTDAQLAAAAATDENTRAEIAKAMDGKMGPHLDVPA